MKQHRGKKKAVIALMSLQFASFLVGALVHFGVLASGFEHRKAGTAESVIATGLFVGLGLYIAYRRGGIALSAQIFALAGTLVGLVMIVIGVGPRSSFDYVLHAAMFTFLVVGLVVTRIYGGSECRNAALPH